MPIPNTSTLYQKIGKGSEGGSEFARFVRLLLIASYEVQGIDFVSESDASGDFKGVDAYISGGGEFPKNITGFQFKFYPSKLSANQKAEVIKSIENAIEQNPQIEKFILITPEDFMKEQQEWFDKVKAKYQRNYSLNNGEIIQNCYFEILHWGHTKILELALKFDHIGIQYFPELYPVGIGKFKLASSKIDLNNCMWLQSEYSKFGYYQSFRDERVHLTTDPVFDFQFTNNSTEIFLLEKIEIHIEEIKALIKGIPADQFLKSIGTIKFGVDFTKPINTIEFNDPLIFDATKPKRFNIQLTSFVKNCPGNYIRLKFWFHFSNYAISTNMFSLSF